MLLGMDQTTSNYWAAVLAIQFRYVLYIYIYTYIYLCVCVCAFKEVGGRLSLPWLTYPHNQKRRYPLQVKTFTLRPGCMEPSLLVCCRLLQ